MNIRIFSMSSILFSGIFSWGIAQDPFYLEDLNPSSETYGQIVSTADFLGDICIVFFGHES
jgi:hypothetical protein